jgi:hypothetical protein
MNINKIRDWILTESHVPVGLCVFIVTSICHFRSHLDLGANYTNSLYALYGFLGAHGISQAKYNTQGGDEPKA